jgi:hypothetical protein
MTRKALGVVKRCLVLQLVVRIMTGYATDSRIKLVMSLAVKNPVGLKSHILKSALRRHLHHLHKPAVTRTAKLLRQSVRIKRSRVEDLQPGRVTGIDRSNVSFARPMAAFAGNARNHAVQLQSVPGYC